MSQISGVGNSGSVGGVDSLGTCTSVNFIFAKLQMELAASAKDSALGYIDQIEQAQKDQKEIADMLQQCRQLQADAKTSGGCTTMPDNIVKFMDKNAIQRIEHGDRFVTDIELAAFADFFGVSSDVLLGKKEADQ